MLMKSCMLPQSLAQGAGIFQCSSQDSKYYCNLTSWSNRITGRAIKPYDLNTLAQLIMRPMHFLQDDTAAVTAMTEEERQQLLRHLKSKWAVVNAAYQKLGFVMDLASQVSRPRSPEMHAGVPDASCRCAGSADWISSDHIGCCACTHYAHSQEWTTAVPDVHAHSNLDWCPIKTGHVRQADQFVACTAGKAEGGS